MTWFARSALVAAFSTWAAAAQALPVLWETNDAMVLSGLNIYVGPTTETFHGSFIYDADTDTISDVQFFSGTRGGVAFPKSTDAGITRTDVLPPDVSQAVTLAVDCPPGPFPCDLQTFEFLLSAPDMLTNAGGVFDVDASYSTLVTSLWGTATLTGTPLTAPVPLPAGLPLLLAGLGGVALMRRRSGR